MRIQAENRSRNSMCKNVFLVSIVRFIIPIFLKRKTCCVLAHSVKLIGVSLLIVLVYQLLPPFLYKVWLRIRIKFIYGIFFLHIQVHMNFTLSKCRMNRSLIVQINKYSQQNMETILNKFNSLRFTSYLSPSLNMIKILFFEVSLRTLEMTQIYCLKQLH